MDSGLDAAHRPGMTEKFVWKPQHFFTAEFAFTSGLLPARLPKGILSADSCGARPSKSVPFCAGALQTLNLRMISVAKPPHFGGSCAGVAPGQKRAFGAK